MSRHLPAFGLVVDWENTQACDQASTLSFLSFSTKWGIPSVWMGLFKSRFLALKSQVLYRVWWGSYQVFFSFFSSRRLVRTRNLLLKLCEISYVSVKQRWSRIEQSWLIIHHCVPRWSVYCYQRRYGSLFIHQEIFNKSSFILTSDILKCN